MSDWLAAWRDPSYLAVGNERQRRALVALSALGVFHDLAEHDLVLAGTIPLDVDLPGSDLDLIATARDLPAFERKLAELYGRLEEFRVHTKLFEGGPSVIATFRYLGWVFQVFAQARPVADQNAVRHLVAEARLLGLAGAEVREEIRERKSAGRTTEEAFADVFGIGGDPYAELYRLATADEEELVVISRSPPHTT